MKVPSNCIICNEGSWIGGHACPGNKMRVGLRVFYDCGSSLSIKSVVDGAFILLAKNCLTETNGSNVVKNIKRRK